MPEATGEELAAFAELAGWGSYVLGPSVKGQAEIDWALGTGRQDYGLVSVWWD